MTTTTHHTVRDYMTPRPCTVEEDLPLADAADRMAANDVHHLLVLRDGRFVGTIGIHDIHLATALARPRRAPARRTSRRPHRPPELVGAA